MKISKVYFNTDDGLRLIGLLHEPEDIKTNIVMISVHGVTSNCLNYRDEIIAKKLTENNIAYFSFDNRGHDVLNTYDSLMNMNYQGSCAEDIRDSYYDIKAAINCMVSKKFNKIIVQGHSMGCTKVVYTYNKFLENGENNILKYICGISLLSMVDVPEYLKVVLGENYDRVIEYLKIIKGKGKGNQIIAIDNFPPVKPNTILNFEQDSELDFFSYTAPTYKFEKLNNIKVPLFMRWGNVNELITIPAEELVDIVKRKVMNKKVEIDFIDGANHSYKNKENVLAEQIINWITRFYIGL